MGIALLEKQPQALGVILADGLLDRRAGLEELPPALHLWRIGKNAKLPNLVENVKVAADCPVDAIHQRKAAPA